MFYRVNDAKKLRLTFVDFDLCYTTHLYNMQKSKTLCGQHKNYEPMSLCDPHYDENICGRCEQILKNITLELSGGGCIPSTLRICYDFICRISTSVFMVY